MIHVLTIHWIYTGFLIHIFLKIEDDGNTNKWNTNFSSDHYEKYEWLRPWDTSEYFRSVYQHMHWLCTINACKISYIKIEATYV